MNITGVSVSDRRATKNRPIISVVVDEMPVSTNDAITRKHNDDTWTSAKYGPLLEFAAGQMRRGPGSNNEHYHDLLERELSPSGWYNEVYADGLAPIVDIKVIVMDHEGQPTAEDVLDGHWGIQLRRARALLRRFEVPWTLKMNDADGIKGRISWVPVMDRQICCADYMGLTDPPFGDCPNKGIYHIHRSGIDYWVCEKHHRVHSAQAFQARTSK